MANVFKEDKNIKSFTGVDKKETIKFMSGYCEKKISAKGITKEELRNELNQIIRVNMIKVRENNVLEFLHKRWAGIDCPSITYSSDG